MSQSENNQNPAAEEALEQAPNYALESLIFIIKTALIAAGVFGLAWILVSVKF